MMLERVLVATDLTAGSDDVLRAAAAVAAVAGAELHVLHSFDFQKLPYSDDTVAHVTFQSRIRDAERALEEQIRRAVRPGVEVASSKVIIYVAHKAILERAREVSADLIVLGPHRKRARGDAFLGTTADRVIRTAEVPCLVVRGPVSLPLRRVLVPLDLSEPAFGALEVALEWSDALRPHDEDPRPGSELVVLHVIPRVFDFDDVPFDSNAIGSDFEQQVKAARARVGGTSTVDLRTDVRWGDSPTEEILRVAQQEQVDLLVMGTHGYGALGRALIGSVASGVARGASCPLLLVPPASGLK